MGANGRKSTSGLSKTGSNDADILSGVAGSYLLSGGRGDDTYIVDDAGDAIDEKNNGGTDLVISWISFSLGLNLENLTLDGADNLSGTGNDQSNTIRGNSGANVLSGLGGDDILDGGAGDDRLLGGAGDDVLIGGDGSDLLDGGDGTDTAVFSGLSSDYTVEAIGAELRVTSLNGSVDVLRSVEYLSFDDGRFAATSFADPAGPTAVDDSATNTEDRSVVIRVLDNDQGKGLTVASATSGALGSVTVNPDGTVTYLPNANANGIDHFSYTIIDANGKTSTADVTVDIASVNDAPVARADSYAVQSGQTLTGSASVLANDSDPDGDALQVAGIGRDMGAAGGPVAGVYQLTTQAGGAVTMNPDGTFVYTPAAGYSGTDSFSYMASDGKGGTSAGSVTVSVGASVPYYIDGLIFGDPYRLNYPDAPGTGTVVTYAFLDSLPAYYGSGSIYESGFTGFSAEQQDATRQLLATISSLTGLTFVETTSDQAGMTFALGDIGGFNGMAARPEGDGVGSLASDVWLNVSYAGDAMVSGTAQYVTLLHEIGHALGLQHADVPAGEANQQYTVMGGLENPTYVALPTGYQLYDVTALQYLYGANTSHNSGDDVYRFADVDDSLRVIWDAGGRDTLDMSAATNGVRLDLRAGAFSTVATSGTNNLAIAYGAVIEDAKGGAWNDVLIGNGADNRLTGGGGADVFGFAAGWGHDTVTDFEHGVDLLDFSATGLGFADLTVTQVGSDILLSHGADSVLVQGVSSVDASDFAMI